MILLTVFFLVILVLFPKEVSQSVSEALFICLKQVIPALFPFAVASGLLLNTSCDFKSPPLTLLEKLFNISKKSAWAFLMGILCGYPIGGKISLELYEKGEISEAEKNRLLIFANIPGPAFIIGVVGASLLNNIKAGIIIYISHLLTAFIFGIASFKKSQKTQIIPVFKKKKQNFLPILANSISSSTQAVIGITGVICFFAAITSALKLIPFIRLIPFYDFFLGFLEMTGGIYNICRMGLNLKFKAAICAFSAGFSGVCVFMQLKCISDKIKPAAYFLNKLLFGTLCALITFIFCQFFLYSL